MTKSRKYLEIVKHYENCLERHGDTHKGVDWPKLEDAIRRYQVMIDVIRPEGLDDCSLLDFGCGAAHLYNYLQDKNLDGVRYAGLDVSEKFIRLSRSKYPDVEFYCVDLLKNPDAIPSFDYVVMNGVFTEKRELTFAEMFSYFKALLAPAFHKTRIGLAFNVMSTSVDWQRDDLFHLSADALIDFLTKELTRNFVIRNDYGLYEYTTYIYH